jgi:hypothetical protein
MTFLIKEDLSIFHPHVNVPHANKYKEWNWMEFRSFSIQVDFPMLEYVLKYIPLHQTSPRLDKIYPYNQNSQTYPET